MPAIDPEALPSLFFKDDALPCLDIVVLGSAKDAHACVQSCLQSSLRCADAVLENCLNVRYLRSPADRSNLRMHAFSEVEIADTFEDDVNKA